MTVQRMEGIVCAGWTYVDEHGETQWLVVLRCDGEWVQLGDDGVSFDQSAGKLREFIDEWMNEAAVDNGESTPWPAADVAEVYRAAADFIDAQAS